MTSKPKYLTFLILVQLAYSCAAAAFTFSESSTNSDPSDWLGWDESHVFYKKLSHDERGHAWVMKIGKGGQIYSIKIPGLDELIGYQRTQYGQWVDEVYQHTIPLPPQKSPVNNKVVDGDIHQAGYYIISDLDYKKKLLTKSVYSPLFAFDFDLAASSVSYITWPQHAHLPRRYSENQVLISQRIKDVGGGVIEITVEFNKWGGVPYDRFGLPFTAFRASTLPVHILSDKDGNYREVTQRKQGSKVWRLSDGTTGGWIAFTTSGAPNAKGIGIVFGKKPLELDKRTTYVSWGNHDSAKIPGIDFTVAAVKRSVDLDIGETLIYRYYLVLGTLANIQVKANNLESKVSMQKIKRSPEETEHLEVCLNKYSIPKRNCEKGESQQFKTYKHYLPGSQPLFLLKEKATNNFIVTNNPYELSFDPTDGITEYADMLGWAVPETSNLDMCKHHALGVVTISLGQQIQIGKNATHLHVLRPNSSDCPVTK